MLNPRLVALSGILVISFSAILVRAAGVSPGTSAFFRAAYALSPLFLLWFALRRRDTRPVRDRWLAFAAGVFLGIDLNLWHRAIDYVGAGLATVLGNTQVLFVGLLAWLVQRERPTNASLVAIPVAFAGVALTTGLGQAGTYGSRPGLGALLGVLTGLAYAGYLLVLRRANQGRGITVGPVLDATAGAAAAAFVLALAFDPAFSLAPAWPAHGFLLLLALGAHAAGWLVITHALPRLPAVETSVLLLLQPCLTVLWGVLLFREDPSWVQWAGVGVVLLAVGGASLAGSRRSAAVPSFAEPAALPVAPEGAGKQD